MDVCNLYIGEKYKEIRVKCNWITNKENSRNKRNIKLNLEKANEIRTLYNSGYYTQKELAEKFIVSTSTICNIINNRYWAE